MFLKAEWIGIQTQLCLIQKSIILCMLPPVLVMAQPTYEYWKEKLNLKI